jgi:hypothetical protein
MHYGCGMYPVNACEFVQMRRTDFKFVSETLFRGEQVTVLEAYLNDIKYRNYARENSRLRQSSRREKLQELQQNL